MPLRGSRFSRLRIDNDGTTAPPPPAGGGDATDHRKLAELEPRDGKDPGRNDPSSSGGEGGEDRENLTEHESLLEESYVDLRNLSLPENYGLDLANADPSFAARQIMERITSNVRRMRSYSAPFWLLATHVR